MLGGRAHHTPFPNPPPVPAARPRPWLTTPPPADALPRPLGRRASHGAARSARVRGGAEDGAEVEGRELGAVGLEELVLKLDPVEALGVW